MKPLIVVPVIIVGLTQSPSKTPEGKGTAKTYGAQRTDQTRAGQSKEQPSARTAPTPNSTDAPIISENQVDAAPHDDHAPDTNKQTRDEEIGIQRKLALFTGALVGVGFLQVCAMIWQVCIYRKTLGKISAQVHETKQQRVIMKRQLDEMQRSITLQEILQQQWLQIDGWRIEGRENNKVGPVRSLKVAFEIDNPTGIPLTIEEVSVNIAGDSYKSTIRNTLSPTDNPIPARFPIILTDKDSVLYGQYGFIFSIIGLVKYRDAFGKIQEQPFGQNCRCGPGNYEIFSPLDLSEPKRL